MVELCRIFSNVTLMLNVAVKWSRVKVDYYFIEKCCSHVATGAVICTLEELENLLFNIALLTKPSLWIYKGNFTNCVRIM